MQLLDPNRPAQRGEAGRHLTEGLLEEVAGTLELGAAVALGKLLQVGQPDVALTCGYLKIATPFSYTLKDSSQNLCSCSAQHSMVRNSACCMH